MRHRLKEDSSNITGKMLTSNIKRQGKDGTGNRTEQ